MENSSVQTPVITNVIATSNAAPLDLKDLPNLKPENIITVYGTPGGSFVASVTAEAKIEKSGILRDQATFDITDSGEACFTVCSPLTSKKISANDISAILTFELGKDGEYGPPDNIPLVPVVFLNYQESEQAIEFIAYNYTTGAPADGKTPCTVYLMVDRKPNDVSKVRIHVDNGAVINGYYHDTADVTLDSDGSATIEITNNNEGKTSVTLTSAPFASDNDRVNFDIFFKKQPK